MVSLLSFVSSLEIKKPFLSVFLYLICLELITLHKSRICKSKQVQKSGGACFFNCVLVNESNTAQLG